VNRARPDVVVVGGGVIGCSVARELARRGSSVVVVERDSPGRRATWAAAGMLSPLGESGGTGPFLELADASLRLYAAFALALREESGIDVEYRTGGKLHVALDGDDAELHVLATSPAADRFGVRLLDGAEARRLEPAISGRVSAGLLVERDYRVNNRLLTQALLASGMAAGVTFRNASPVTALLNRGDHAAGVRLASGEEVEAGHVVIAAGAWSPQIEGLPRPLPVQPVKGQMFAVDARARDAQRPAEPLLNRVTYASRCYVIPREDGRLLIGATVEDAGFRKGATPRGIAALMAAAMDVIPVIADLPLVETWAGFRPATPDGLPILGTDPTLNGLVYACGHYRNGILLAPVTATAIADIVTGATGTGPGTDLKPFDIRRFDR
jgi:glycine oxidase